LFFSGKCLFGFVRFFFWRGEFGLSVLLAKGVSRLSLGFPVVDDVFQAVAAKQLLKIGFQVSAGQNVCYLITEPRTEEL